MAAGSQIHIRKLEVFHRPVGHAGEQRNGVAAGIGVIGNRVILAIKDASKGFRIRIADGGHWILGFRAIDIGAQFNRLAAEIVATVDRGLELLKLRCGGDDKVIGARLVFARAGELNLDGGNGGFRGGRDFQIIRTLAQETIAFERVAYDIAPSLIIRSARIEGFAPSVIDGEGIRTSIGDDLLDAGDAVMIALAHPGVQNRSAVCEDEVAIGNGQPGVIEGQRSAIAGMDDLSPISGSAGKGFGIQCDGVGFLFGRTKQSAMANKVNHRSDQHAKSSDGG